MTASDQTASRTPLTTERVVRAAIDLADRRGLGALTMRRLGAELGVEAMSLYKHVANKDAILAAMVDLVIAEIALPEEGTYWRAAMALRARSAREVLGRHTWMIGLLEAGMAPGPSAMRYLDAIIGSLRSAGFAMEDVARAFTLLDSFVYGHVIQEAHLPFATRQEMTDAVAASLARDATRAFPHLAAMYEHALSYEFAFDAQFEFGLELVLDGLERLHPSDVPPSG